MATNDRTVNYEIDTGLVVAAERYAAETNSHGILNMLIDYRGWVDICNSAKTESGIKASRICANAREDKLRKALLANNVTDRRR